MTPEEIGQLLATCASFDRRKTGPLDVIAWHRVLGDLRYDECEDAVIAHYTDGSEWIMPAHVRTRVKAARKNRVEVAGGIPAPPPELIDDPERYRAWLANAVQRIADGESPAEVVSHPLRELGPA